MRRARYKPVATPMFRVPTRTAYSKPNPPPANVTPLSLRLFRVFGLILLILAGCFAVGWMNWIKLQDEPVREKPAADPLPQPWENSRWDGAVPIVRDYIMRNANDPSSIEFVEWSKVYDSPAGHHEVRVRMRGKNAYGAKVLTEAIVKFSNMEVLKITPL